MDDCGHYDQPGICENCIRIDLQAKLAAAEAKCAELTSTIELMRSSLRMGDFKKLQRDLATERAARAEAERLALPWIRDVREFHEGFGVPIETDPTMSTPERRVLRARLILEEAGETVAAISSGDLIETADGIVDLIYVAIGAALEFGVPLDRVWREVHRSNMAKLGGPTREDGKVMKPPGWTPPDILRALKQAAGMGEGER